MKKLIKVLWPYASQYTPTIIGALLLALPLAGIKGAQARLVKYIVDNLNAEAQFEDILILAGILLGLGLLNYPCRFFHFYWLRYSVDRSTCKLRTALYQKLQNLPLNYFTKEKTGEILSCVINDTQVLAEGIRNIIDIIREPLTAFFMLGLALYSDWQLTLVIFVVAPLFILIFQTSGRKVRDNQEKVQAELASMTHALSEGLQAQKVVKSFNLQHYILSRFRVVQNKYFRYLMRTTSIEENAHPLVELVGAVAFSGVIVFAWYRIKTGEVTTGDFFSFVTALALMMDPIRKYSQANVKLNKAMAAQKRLEVIFKLPEERSTGELLVDKLEKSIELKNISFFYGEHPEKLVLDNFSMTIKKGMKVALVGQSGSGKSTIISLLLGLYRPTKGEILIDDYSHDQLTLKNIRSIFGTVSQDIFLFHDSVKENLSLGKLYDSAKMEHALEYSNSLKFIEELPDGLETSIGDRGTRLSGGQGQRLTIARAVLKNPSIYLFDEATSALDNESEKLVQDALNRVGEDKTVIAVAHRLSTIKNFDLIIVMREGKKIEEGTHEELMKLRGEYFKLYQLGEKG